MLHSLIKSHMYVFSIINSLTTRLKHMMLEITFLKSFFKKGISILSVLVLPLLICFLLVIFGNYCVTNICLNHNPYTSSFALSVLVNLTNSFVIYVTFILNRILI